MNTDEMKDQLKKEVEIRYVERSTKELEMRNKPGNKVLGIIVAIWFIGSIIASVYLSKHGQNDLMLAVFGQVFFFAGILTICTNLPSKTVSPNGFGQRTVVKSGLFVGILFLLVGGGAVAGGLMWHYNVKAFMDNANTIIPAALCGLFAVVGLGVMIGAAYKIYCRNNYITQTVLAKIVDIDSHSSNNTRVYAPVYEYYFNGQNYREKTNYYSNVRNYEIGDVREIRINPNMPEEIDAGIKNLIGEIVFGAIFFAVGAGVLIFLFRQ